MPTRVQEAEFRAVYAEWCQGRLTRAEAAARLEMSVRTFGRYVARFRTQGSQWWEDRSRHHPSSHRAPEPERARLQTLYSERYPGWNVRHFYTMYRDEHGGKRSYTWVKNVLQDTGLAEQRAPNSTPKRVRGEHERESIGRKPRDGMLLHQIASRREWASGHTWNLVLTVDDATNRVHSGFFVEALWIWSVFKGIRETLEKGLFGSLSLPGVLPTRLTEAESTFGGRTRPQLERAILELGIELSPPAPRIGARRRRLIGTLLGRLPQALATEGIAEIDLANAFLPRFWTGFNKSLGKATESSSAFSPLTTGMATVLVDVLCLKHKARICNGNRLFCKDREVEIPRGWRQHLCESREYRIHEYEDGSSKIFSRGTSGLDRLKWTELT